MDTINASVAPSVCGRLLRDCEDRKATPQPDLDCSVEAVSRQSPVKAMGAGALGSCLFLCGYFG